MQTNIAELITPAFDGVFYDVQEHEHTHYWLKGGRGSTKSSFISIVAPLLLLQNPDCHMIVMRKVARTLKTSVYNQMEWSIARLGLSDRFKMRSSPLEFEYMRTGQKILFFGVDDKSKIKSLKLPFGYTGIIWFEELDQFFGMEEIRNLLQSLMRGGNRFWVFYSYNPPKSVNNWVNQETMIERPDRLVHHSTYKTTPQSWLGDAFSADAEELQRRNELLYRHEYEGEVTGTGGGVFDNVVDMDMTDEQIAGFGRLRHGLDFGFAVDPLAYVDMHLDTKRGELYIFGEVYGQKISNKRAADIIAPRARGRVIGADSAEPKSIAEMRGYGLNVIAAKKGPDSVDYGIQYLQRLSKIYIDKRRAPNTYREFVGYEYERNREGEFISAYPDKDNHTIDAVRYGLERDMLRARITPKRANIY